MPPLPLSIFGWGIGTWTCFYAAYRWGTYEKRRVWIKEKYRHVDRQGFTPLYVFVDSHQDMYSIPFSLLSMQFNPEKKWKWIEQSEVYRIHMWGIHCPWLGLYRRVDQIEKINWKEESIHTTDISHKN